MNNQAKILIVDDEPFNVDYLEQELEDLDYHTVAATNGQEALDMVASENPDVVLLDIMMPILDGFEVLARLKANNKTRDIPVIVISAASDMSNVIRGIELGAEDFLPKPFDPILLRARVSASLQKKRWHDRERIFLQQIESEKKRTDELLRIILPEPIIDELKHTNQVQPRHFENVAVLFTDVVGFTQYCDTHAPEDVARNLQQMIGKYEEAALRFNLEKIKTNGDAFMATAGLFSNVENPVLQCIQCGWEMVKLANQLPDPWQVRVGIHVGPVMGAILGHRQFLFDIWGDTVNTAQRCESYGAPDAVNISQEAWNMVSHACQGTSLGLAQVKGKGSMEIFQVTPLTS